MALLTLDKLDQACDAANRGLTIDANNKSLQQIRSKIAARRNTVDALTEKKKAEEATRAKGNLVKSTALKARQIRTRKTNQPPDMEGSGGIRLVPDPLSPESMLEFPVVFLYPMHAQSDFVKAFSEMHCVADHLAYIFPLPWDEHAEYATSQVECFMDTVSGGLVKVGKKLPLLKILAGGKVEVVDELVRVYVVPTGLVGMFIGEMKARSGKTSGS